MLDARTSRGTWTRDVPAGETSEVTVTGVPGAHRTTLQAMAVLRVEPADVPFQVGWNTQDYPDTEYYSEPVRTHNGEFAMAVGEEDPTFVVRALDGVTPIALELVEVVAESDDRYAETPRY